MKIKGRKIRIVNGVALRVNNIDLSLQTGLEGCYIRALDAENDTHLVAFSVKNSNDESFNVFFLPLHYAKFQLLYSDIQLDIYGICKEAVRSTQPDQPGRAIKVDE